MTPGLVCLHSLPSLMIRAEELKSTYTSTGTLDVFPPECPMPTLSTDLTPSSFAMEVASCTRLASRFAKKHSGTVHVASCFTSLNNAGWFPVRCGHPLQAPIDGLRLASSVSNGALVRSRNTCC